MVIKGDTRSLDNGLYVSGYLLSGGSGRVCCSAKDLYFKP